MEQIIYAECSECGRWVASTDGVRDHGSTLPEDASVISTDEGGLCSVCAAEMGHPVIPPATHRCDQCGRTGTDGYVHVLSGRTAAPLGAQIQAGEAALLCRACATDDE